MAPIVRKDGDYALAITPRPLCSKPLASLQLRANYLTDARRTALAQALEDGPFPPSMAWCAGA